MFLELSFAAAGMFDEKTLQNSLIETCKTETLEASHHKTIKLLDYQDQNCGGAYHYEYLGGECVSFIRQ